MPSLRTLLLRDGIEDFEYATILSGLLRTPGASEEARGAGEAALAMFRRHFATPVSWSLSEAHWQQVREAMGDAIEKLQEREGR